MNKIYFLDNGYRNSILKNFDHPERRYDKGASLENLFFTQITYAENEDVNFWRTADKNEVDFIIDRKRAFEIKFTENAFKISKYKKFIKYYPEIPLSPVSYAANNEFSIIDFLV
jgi:predicted AAA+ superfamily ATPase